MENYIQFLHLLDERNLAPMSYTYIDLAQFNCVIITVNNFLVSTLQNQN
jgi:hypothetical protein